MKTSYICLQCGKNFEKWPSERIKSLVFCSYKCKAKFQIGKHHGGHTEICKVCDKIFYIKPYAVKMGRKCCSKKCSNIYKQGLTGKKSARWINGIQKHSGGYLEQPITQKVGKAKRILQHRRVMEEYFGHSLQGGVQKLSEVVHHIDGDKTNNDIDNLELMTFSEHAKLHALINGLGKYKRL